MKITKVCKICNENFEADTREINRGNANFCSLSCAAIYNNYNRNIKLYNHTCLQCESNFTSQSKNAKYCCQNCKQKYYRKASKGNNKICSKTASKNLAHLPCAICGWIKARRDVHHIQPVSKGGTHEQTNLITLCPNCHRMAHSNLISKEQLKKAVQNRTISSSSNEEQDAKSGN